MEHAPALYSARPAQWVIALILIVMCLVAYIPAMRAGFIWDDDAYVTENPLLSARDGLKRIWFSLDHPSQYFPLTYTVFRLQYKMWEFNPFGYHLVNVLFHIANAFLVWLILLKLRIRGSWLAAAVFMLHPVNVESVAWITELKNVLMAFCCLLSILAWLRFIDRPELKIKDWAYYVLSLALYILALFSKTTACTLPAAMVLILWFRRISNRVRNFGLIIPYVALGVAMGLVTVWWEHIKGSGGVVLKLNYLERTLLASRALWFYIGKLILPIKLTFSYPLWKIDWTKPIGYTWILAAVCVVALMWRYRAKIGRGSITAVLYFVVMLSPVLGFVSLYTFHYSYVADHYVYMACIGPIALFTAVVSGLWHKAAPAARGLMTVCIAGILILLGILTWRQGHIYKDIETLWRDTLDKNPDSLLAHANLGLMLDRRGNVEQAVVYYYKALEIYPEDEVVLYNLGNISKSKGKLDEAVAYYKKAIQTRPNYVDAYNNLANTLKMQGKFDEAVECYKTALVFGPRDAKTYYNLANTFLQQERIDEAITFYRQCISLEPGFIHARINFAIALESNGDVDEAINQYRKVLELDPDSLVSLCALTELLIRKSDIDVRDANEAVRCAEHAAVLTDYNEPKILNMLAMTYAVADDWPKTEKTAQRALDLAVEKGNKKLANRIRIWLELHKRPD